jgi:hypothetical protein
MSSDRSQWYRSDHVKPFESNRMRARLGEGLTRFSLHIRGEVEAFGLVPGALRGLPSITGLTL